MEELTQKEIWNTIAHVWNAMSQHRELFFDVKDFLKDKQGNILDLGCGSGRNFSAVPLQATLYGVDFSEKMISLARKRIEELGRTAQLQVAYAHQLPFTSDFFDVSIYVAALHCIPSGEERKQSLNELYRVLRPGAKAFITVWSKNHERIDKGIKEQDIPWTVDGKKYMRFYYIYDKEELEHLVQEAGFIIDSSTENNNIIITMHKPL